MEHYTINKQKKIIFCWSPKCNCTGIIKMFFKYVGCYEQAILYSSWIHNYRVKIYNNINPITIDDLNNDDFLKIKFVRCPYDRAVSIFVHSYKTDSLISNTFEDFLNKLYTKQYNSVVESHSRPQFDGFNNWTELVKCENINERIGDINKKYNLNLDLSVCNSPHYNKKYENCKNKTYNYVGNKNIDDELCKENYVNFYNEYTKNLVNKIYGKDVELFEYSYEDFVKRNYI